MQTVCYDGRSFLGERHLETRCFQMSIRHSSKNVALSEFEMFSMLFTNKAPTNADKRVHESWMSLRQ